MTTGARRVARVATASLTLVAILVARPVAGQSPADRAALDRFRDSVRAIGDVPAIQVLERQTVAALGKAHSKAIPALRLGFVQLRRGELTQDRAAFAEAEQTFNDVVKAEANWPLGWLGRGLARLNQADNRSVVARFVRTVFATDFAGDAAKDIAQSAIVDSQYVEGLLKLSNIAAADQAGNHLRAALLALRQVTGKPAGRNLAVELARIRIERIGGDPDSAWLLVHNAAAHHPSDPGLLMELGHLEMSRHDESGAADWFRGLALADADLMARYREDLRLLFPDTTMVRFDAATRDQRVTLVHDFMAVDDEGVARSFAGRLREHYLRLDHARAAFVLPLVKYRADIPAAFVPNEREMDDRGLVWVLHGPPDQHSYLNQIGAPANESWQYAREDGGELLFHFVKTDDTRGYVRVASLFDVLAMSKVLQATGHDDIKSMAARGEAVQTYGASWTAQTVQDMLYSREAMSPTYGRMLSRGKNGALELQLTERAVGDSSIKAGETRGTHYELALDAQVDVVAVGTDAAGPMLQLAYAIPGSSLYADPTIRPVVYPIRMRATVIRRGTGKVVATIDTLRQFVTAEPVPETSTLFGRLPLHVPAGDYMVRIALESPSRGVMGPREVVRVAALAPDSIDLSDLAMGARSVRLSWLTAAGDTVWINPARTFRVGEPMQLFFEVFGLPVGTKYQAELRVFKAGDRNSQLAVGFGTTASGAPDAVHRELDLSRLGTGSYELQVTVTAPGGAKAVRRGEFTVVK